LCGHDKSVSCVALSVDLDLAVSGSEDGTVNVYTVKEGYYLRTLIPPDPGFYFTISHLGLSGQGQMVFSGHSRDVHSIHVYSLNGRWLASEAVAHRISALVVEDGFLLTGDENGDLVLRDLFTMERLHSVPLHLPVQTICLVAGNTHALVPLRDGKLIIIGSKPN
jgi:WD40 repeat protein